MLTEDEIVKIRVFVLERNALVAVMERVEQVSATFPSADYADFKNFGSFNL
ncbi:MAG: hypothetical protein GX433_00580 [Deltaproteobacteria bacterium]|nr:hypothetical protein [Deltaproteobacteria bacterium]